MQAITDLHHDIASVIMVSKYDTIADLRPSQVQTCPTNAP